MRRSKVIKGAWKMTSRSVPYRIARYAGLTATHFHGPLVRDYNSIFGCIRTKAFLQASDLLEAACGVGRVAASVRPGRYRE